MTSLWYYKRPKRSKEFIFLLFSQPLLATVKMSSFSSASGAAILAALSSTPVATIKMAPFTPDSTIFTVVKQEPMDDVTTAAAILPPLSSAPMATGNMASTVAEVEVKQEPSIFASVNMDSLSISSAPAPEPDASNTVVTMTGIELSGSAAAPDAAAFVSKVLIVRSAEPSRRSGRRPLPYTRYTSVYPFPSTPLPPPNSTLTISYHDVHGNIQYVREKVGANNTHINIIYDMVIHCFAVDVIDITTGTITWSGEYVAHGNVIFNLSRVNERVFISVHPPTDDGGVAKASAYVRNLTADSGLTSYWI